MADAFEGYAAGLDSPATRHAALSVTGADIDPRPRGIYCKAAGTISVSDGTTALDYDMVAGDVLPFRGKRITAIASGTFYAWW
ncbi:hypothetical protein [Neotabrizicola sp. sgz301269]|uniref:spike base protein, RCAP_Rcc01079 family n=1 Tax=Neotabrizicola sp. sgz301269 TaxID=3276282 RepID=UPI0037706F1A